MNENPLNVIKRADSAVFEQMENARELAFKDGKISRKHKLLIALAIDAAAHSEEGIKSLAGLALENGATRDEIMETLRIVNYICGAGSMYAAAAALKDIF